MHPSPALHFFQTLTATGRPSLPAMYKNRLLTNIPFLLGAALVALDISSLVGAGYLSSFLTIYFKTEIFPDYEFISRLQEPSDLRNFYFILGAVTTSIIWGKGLYTNRTPWWSQVQFIAKVIIFSILVHGFMSFALKIYESRMLILLSWSLAFLFMIFFRALAYKVAAFVPTWKIPTVIISDNATAEDLIYAFASDLCTGYDVKTIFLRMPDDNIAFDASILPASQKTARICYGQDDHESFIRENPNYFYIVSLDTFRDGSRESMIKTLNDNNVPYAVVPALCRVNLYQMEPRYFFGHDVVMLYVGNSAPQIFGASLSKLLKRGMDIVLSGLALLIFSPVFLAIICMLKIEGQRGSPFYGGKRIGKSGQMFNCWKFRSMEPNSDHLLKAYLDANPDARLTWEKYRKLPNDPRITTQTARFIRKSSLDELPQLWNIFVGNMSLVGPRPILEEEIHYFEPETLKEYLSIRPGLTGLWQVSGRNKTSFKRRIYWDSWYVRNWSLWGDIVIIIKTPLVLLTRRGAS